MVRQVEVVVAGKGEQAAAVALDPEPVGAGRLGKRAAQALGLKRRQLACREILKRTHQKSSSGVCPLRRLQGRQSGPKLFRERAGP